MLALLQQLNHISDCRVCLAGDRNIYQNKPDGTREGVVRPWQPHLLHLLHPPYRMRVHRGPAGFSWMLWCDKGSQMHVGICKSGMPTHMRYLTIVVLFILYLIRYSEYITECCNKCSFSYISNQSGVARWPNG